MTLIRRLPIYAAGAGFALAVAIGAAAADWSGWELLLVALGVSTFYIVTILVPWLIREQVSTETAAVSMNGHPVRLQFAGDVVLVPVAGDHDGLRSPATHGPAVIRQSDTPVTTTA